MTLVFATFLIQTYHTAVRPPLLLPHYSISSLIEGLFQVIVDIWRTLLEQAFLPPELKGKPAKNMMPSVTNVAGQ